MKSIIIHAAKDLRLEDQNAESIGLGQVMIKLATGGICSSDLHYYNHGGFGAIRLREPMILEHEVAGVEPHRAGRALARTLGRDRGREIQSSKGDQPHRGFTTELRTS